MAAYENVPSSFFKFYSHDFETRLTIPTAFATAHHTFLRQVSLQLVTDGLRSWDVKIKKIDGVHYIVDGEWSDFVKDNNLLPMKLLVFRITASSTLHVTIFGHDSCFELPASPNPSYESVAGITWRFARKLKGYNIWDQRMDIPILFVKGTGIDKKMYLTLEDVHGRKWPVSVTDRGQRMFNMSKGWVDFVRANDLEIGLVLLFEFVPSSDNVVKVVGIEGEAGKEVLVELHNGLRY